MATDRNGTTIEDGDDIVVIGKRRGSAGSGRSLIVVGDTPIVVADDEIVAADGIGAGGGGILSLPFLADVATQICSNIPSGPRWCPKNNTLAIFSIPGDLFTRARIGAVVDVAGSSGTVVDLVYRTSYSATVDDYSDIAASGHVRIAIDAAGVVDSGWVDIAAGAKVDPIFVGLASSGGDGSSDAWFGRVWAFFQ